MTTLIPSNAKPFAVDRQCERLKRMASICARLQRCATAAEKIVRSELPIREKRTRLAYTNAVLRKLRHHFHEAKTCYPFSIN